jgi:hypothetical protein
LAEVLLKGVFVVPSVELAAPPAPATEVADPPPAPPMAVCVKSSDPVVLPVTAFVNVDGAPTPPAAPELP